MKVMLGFRNSSTARANEAAAKIVKRRKSKYVKKGALAKSGAPKISDEKLAEIRGDYKFRGMTVAKIAAKHDLSETSVSGYLRHISRVHVEPK